MGAVLHAALSKFNLFVLASFANQRQSREGGRGRRREGEKGGAR